MGLKSRLKPGSTLQPLVATTTHLRTLSAAQMLEPSRSCRNAPEPVELVCENCELPFDQGWSRIDQRAGFSQTGEGKATLPGDICLT